MPETMTIGVSLTSSAEVNLRWPRVVPPEGLAVRRIFMLVLALTLLAIAADQFAASILHTYTPLCATAACLLLVWRRDDWPSASGDGAFKQVLAKRRLAVFFAAHFLLILLARWMTSTFQPLAGTPTAGGIVIAACKLTVLVPTLVLLPLARWRELLAAYRPEIVAALVVFITYSPWRTAQAIWPWYGQLLGRFVYALARFAVPGLGYVSDLTPTLTGPDLDITIFQGCSGLNGFELFGYLFGVVTLLDWNRLRKGRALFAYFAGLVVILVGNALRITSYLVLGNHGFADLVLRFHLSAGWIFFSVIFLAYLSLTYRWMLKTETAGLQP
jgi:exosortase/archaeosortase family protein